jgi:hypothetical protein
VLAVCLQCLPCTCSVLAVCLPSAGPAFALYFPCVRICSVVRFSIFISQLRFDFMLCFLISRESVENELLVWLPDRGVRGAWYTRTTTANYDTMSITWNNTAVTNTCKARANSSRPPLLSSHVGSAFRFCTRGCTLSRGAPTAYGTLLNSSVSVPCFHFV